MDKQKQTFEFSSNDGVEYRLEVSDSGFEFYDQKTNELLIDGSALILRGVYLSYWPIEIDARPSNRTFYINTHEGGDSVIRFGLSRRE